VEVEREKLLKKAGKKSKELEDKWGPIPIQLYEYLSEDVIKGLLACRLNEPDCNAGVVFDGLNSKYWPDEIFIVKCLMDVVGK
jgi:hydrocephalus-inducing protein